MTVYEMAKKYYPALWDLSRIDALYKAGKLTDEEYRDITGDAEAELEKTKPELS